MNFEKIKREILNRIGKEIAKEGFLMNKKNEDFERIVLGNRDCYILYFVNYDNTIFVEPSWGIINSTIEAVYHQVTEIKLEYITGSFVLYNDMGPLKDYMINGNNVNKIERERHLIENEEDVEKVILILLHDFRTYLLPYFENHHTIDSFDAALNSSNLEDLIIHISNYPYRAIMGLIAAKLNQNPSYHELETIYSKKLSKLKIDPQAMREYIKVKQLLEELPFKN